MLNFLDSDWGLVRSTSGGLLNLVGYDVANGRGVYELEPEANVRQVEVEASRWRMQLGATLSF